MKLRKLLIVSGILLFISGCSEFMMICSLNPFYLDKNIAIVPEIGRHTRFNLNPILTIKIAVSGKRPIQLQFGE